MAGGKGTRIASVNTTVPKPMIEICEKPILQYQIECLKKQGYIDIILVIGHMGDMIEKFFGDGSRFGVSISYIREKEPLGTAGALYYCKEIIQEDFLLINGDIIFDVDLDKFYQAHLNNKAAATIFTHPNNHPYDSSVILTTDENRVCQWLTKEEERTWYSNRVNAGLHLLSPEVLESIDSPQKKDLDRDLLKPLIQRKKLYAYDSPEYIKDMGTPERYFEVTKDIKSGIVSKKNLINKQKAIFLDRDGTINQYVGFLTDLNQVKLIKGVADAIKWINQSGYLCIIVTNQPVVARGEVSIEELQTIHNKIETLLGEAGAYVDDIFYCPHHPDKGFVGERTEYKIVCDCRKPQPGMLFRAAAKYNIDLSQSWMVGDSKIDIEAGKRAGCQVAYIGTNFIDHVSRYQDLRTCINEILGVRRYMYQLIQRYPILESIKNTLEKAYKILEECYGKHGKLLIAGNGGSAADAEHITGELMKGFLLTRKLDAQICDKLESIDSIIGKELAEKLQYGLPTIALTNHNSLNTAFLNDVEGTMCFAQQVFAYGEDKDVFLGISTSGNSLNVLYAAVTAKAKGMKVIGLTGKGGGKLAKVADIILDVNEEETYKIQELHLPIYHCLCLMLEEHFFKGL